MRDFVIRTNAPRVRAAVRLLALALLLAVATRPAAAGQAAGGDRAAAPVEPTGAELFATTCKVCHGEAGIGGVGPALRAEKFTRAYVRRAMAEGRPGSMMPEFTRTFSTAQMNAVAEYVAALQSPKGPAPPGLRGNAAAGEAVFFARNARGCAVCHSVGGRGGRVGPELGARVATLSPRDLFQRIVVVPHRASDPAYATVRLTTRLGQILTGITAGETADAVLFYDTTTLPPVLRTIPKKDVQASEAQRESVMPGDYAARLTVQQLLDLVAFLKSAGGAPATVTLGDVVR